MVGFGAKLPVAECPAVAQYVQSLAKRVAMASEIVTNGSGVGELAKPRSENEARQLRMRESEERLLETSLETMESALSWNEYSRDDLTDEVIESLPEDEAKKRRTALAASMPGAMAPVGLKLAANFIVGVMKARAVASATPGSSGPLVQINMVAPVSSALPEGRPVYEVLDME